MKKFLLPIFIFTFIIYKLSSPPGDTPYNYFTRLAGAFAKGQYFITENPPWLSELIPAGQNRFYIVYPPMPALLFVPLVAIWGGSFPQQLLAHALGAGIVVLTIKLSLELKKDERIAIWAGLLTGFGSIIWYLSSVGSSWYLGQICAAFFMMAAILETFTKKRLYLVGFFLGASYLSRVHTILSLPFFFFMLRGKMVTNKGTLEVAVNFMKLFVPLLTLMFFDFAYNLVRYGTIYNRGYFLIPGTLSEPWFSKGIVHPSYIIEDLKIAFLATPKILNSFPYIQPSWAGLAIWITTPAFIYSLRAQLKENAVKLSWLSIFLIFLVVGMHGGTGFAQFGYRFAVDFYPFLIFLTLKGVGRTGIRRWHWLFLIWSVLVNLWGVVWINKFGWISY